MEIEKVKSSSNNFAGNKKKSKKVSKKVNEAHENDKIDELEENLKERLHIKSNGILVTNGNHESDSILKDKIEVSKKSINGLNEEFQDLLCSGTSRINEDSIEDTNIELSSNSNIQSSVTTESASLSIISQSPQKLSQEPSENTAPSQPIIEYKEYECETQMPDIIRLIQKDLSEPYSIYTYRYFIHNWPKLCFLAMHGNVCVGAIVCKLDMHRQSVKRGYIAMLAVDKDYRKLKIGSNLVQKAIQAMLNDYADEVVLETEITNIPALRLYENLGFVRDKRLFHYYLNGVDALRLKLWFR